MSVNWILKIMMAGSPRVGKTSFIKDRAVGEEFHRQNNFLGFSLEILRSTFDNGEVCKCSIWDVKANQYNHFIYPTFFKGAAGCLLFFNLSNRQTFEDLNIWIKLIRKLSANIPIILIGTNSDLETQVSSDEINEFIRDKGILSYYSTSIYGESKRDAIIEHLTTYIIDTRKSRLKNKEDLELIRESLDSLLDQLYRRMGGRYGLYKDEYNSLSKKEKEICDKFIDYFSICPICHRTNHINYIRKFYFSKKKEHIKIKKQLLKLVQKSQDFDEIYYNKIILGIPCCNCYSYVFNEKVAI